MLSFSPVEDLVNYIISHIHEGLLMNKLDNQQLRTNISEGRYILENVEFNSKSINKSLVHSPVHIYSARCSKMNLTLPPLIKILDSSVKIFFIDLVVNLISAKQSGDTVSINPGVPLSQSDETPGLNELTKSIGKFLTSINIEVFLLTINLISSTHSLNLIIPKLLFSEKDGKKYFKIEGFSLLFDGHEKICEVNDVIEGSFTLNSSIFELTGLVNRLFLFLSQSQLEGILDLLNGLEVTDKVDQESSGLVKIINDISKKIDLGNDIKKQGGNITIGRVDFVLSRKKGVYFNWDFEEKIEEKVGSSSFYFRLQGIQIGVGKKVDLKISRCFLDYFEYAEKSPEVLFRSAMDEFSSNFFLCVHDSGEIWQVCRKKVIDFGENGLTGCFDEESLELNIDSCKISMNHNVVNFFLEVLAKIKMNPDKEDHSKQTIKAKKISVKYGQELSEDWDKDFCLSMKVVFLDSFYEKSEKKTFLASRVFGKLRRIKEKFLIFESENFFFESVLRRFQFGEAKKVKKYSGAFDQNQGYITLAKKGTFEQVKKVKILPVDEGGQYGKESISMYSFSSVKIFIKNPVLLYFSQIDFPSFPSEKNQEIFSKSLINIQDTQLSLFGFSAGFKEFHLNSSQDLTQISFTETFIRSPSNHLVSASVSPLKIKVSKNVFKAYLEDLIIDYLIIQDFFDLDLELPESQKQNEASWIIKLLFRNSAITLSSKSAHLALLIEHSKISLFSDNFSCGKLFVGSFKIFYLNQPLLEQYSSAKNIENNKKLEIFSSGSCVEVEYSKKLLCNPRACTAVCENFYYTESLSSSKCDLLFISIGTLIFHVCKDTIQVLEEIVPESLKQNEDINSSIYFDPIAKTRFLHSHNPEIQGVSEGVSSYTSFSINSLFVHLYPDYEFPEPCQSKKSFLYKICPKVSALSCVYTVTKENLSEVSLEILDISLLNYIKGSDIKNLLANSHPKTKAKILAIQLSSNSPVFSTKEINLSVSVSPLTFNLDQPFIEFCIDLFKDDSPVLVQEPGSLKIKDFSVSSLHLTINYQQSQTNTVNILNIENFLIKFPAFKAENFDNIDEAFQNLWDYWIDFMQRHKVITLIGRLSPIVSISNIARALVNIAKSPFDPNNSENTKQGIVTFFKVCSIESLKFCDSVFFSVAKLARRKVPVPLSFRAQRSMKYL